jgi:major membrane immunogen (membrane-anchored lipoprotein)
MRSAVSVAILVCTSFLLAGCADGDKDDDLHYVCSNGVEVHSDDHPDANVTTAEDLAQFCPGSSTGTRTNTTTQAPNVLPILVLNVTDDGGNATSVTMLDGNLTFSAEGSSDPDGTIAGIAVTVTDSNTTRTATLYDTGKGQFKSATFKFDRAGVVNVTVAMVDDRAGFTVNQTHVYVNELIQSQGASVALPRPPDGFEDCGGATETGVVEGDLYEAQFYKEFSFSLAAGATKIEASDPAGNILLTICSPVDVAVSGGPANPTMTTADANLTAPVGTEAYYVAAYMATDDPTPGGQDAAPVIIIHYEPQTDAAPAAE